MKAKANRKFNASVNRRPFSCEAGAQIDADEASVKHLEALGLVKTRPAKRAARPRKAAWK